MTRTEETFLALVKAGIRGEKPEDPQLSGAEWNQLFRLAEAHKLFSLVLDAATGLRSLMAQGPDGQAVDIRDRRKTALAQVNRQVIQENEFLNLVLDLQRAGLDPLVVKGAVCRGLYPKPLLRPSVDDDLLIPPEQAAEYHRLLCAADLIPDSPNPDPEADWELSYHRPNSPLYIELHKCLFDSGSDVFSGWNSWFAQASGRSVPIRIQDVTLRTLHPTDHLLFLILHAFKHFLHSGFGLRIVCDIVLFAREESGRIEFTQVRDACQTLRCADFAAAIFRIGERYLGIPAPNDFRQPEPDVAPLLADILDAGIHGQNIDRLHSANITLKTVAADWRGNGGEKKPNGLRASLFPSAKSLAGKYPYLQRRPFLLPLAWTGRIIGYLRSRRVNRRQVHPTVSLRIGRERISLLEQYGIIDPIGSKKGTSDTPR